MPCDHNWDTARTFALLASKTHNSGIAGDSTSVQITTNASNATDLR